MKKIIFPLLFLSSLSYSLDLNCDKNDDVFYNSYDSSVMFKIKYKQAQTIFNDLYNKINLNKANIYPESDIQNYITRNLNYSESNIDISFNNYRFSIIINNFNQEDLCSLYQKQNQIKNNLSNLYKTDYTIGLGNNDNFMTSTTTNIYDVMPIQLVSLMNNRVLDKNSGVLITYFYYDNQNNLYQKIYGNIGKQDVLLNVPYSEDIKTYKLNKKITLTVQNYFLGSTNTN